MTLGELSREYAQSADLIRTRMRHIRRKILKTQDPEELWHLKHRLRQLSPILTEMNELADLTAHYYDRGYWRSEKYTV